MATNKNASMRYRILDKCFRNTSKRYYYKTLRDEIDNVLQDIDAEHEGISQKTLENDIKFMESAEGWSVDLLKQKDGRRVYLSYADHDFSINNMPLNELEVNQMQSAFNILSQFKGLPQFEWMQELLPKISQGMAVNKSQHTIMSFDNNQDLKGIEHLGTLYNAIHYKEPLLITYRHFFAEAAEDLIIHPYHLKQYNSRWFLFGLNSGNSNPSWNMALDRIENISTGSDAYIENKTINWDEYFDDVIGVTVPLDATVERIILVFNAATANYVETKPLHGSQKSYRKEDGKLEVHLQLKINIELERLLLSFGEALQILEPASLAEKIQNRLKQAVLNYG